MNACSSSKLDRVLARVCLSCTVCRRARKKQVGAVFWMVRRVEGHVCPFCRAYERVYGRKSHEALVKEALEGPLSN